MEIQTSAIQVFNMDKCFRCTLPWRTAAPAEDIPGGAGDAPHKSAKNNNIPTGTCEARKKRVERGRQERLIFDTSARVGHGADRGARRSNARWRDRVAIIAHPQSENGWKFSETLKSNKNNTFRKKS